MKLSGLGYIVLTPPPTPPHTFKNSYWLHPHFLFLSSNSILLISLARSSLVTTSSVALMSLALRDVKVTCQARVLPDVWAQHLSRVVSRLGKFEWTWESVEFFLLVCLEVGISVTVERKLGVIFSFICYLSNIMMPIEIWFEKFLRLVINGEPCP